MQRWPNQLYGVQEVINGYEAGERLMCLTSPTGGGKTRMMLDLIEWAGEAILYTNRRMLLEQISETLNDEGFKHGIRGAGYEPEFGHPVQLAMMQTEDSRWDTWPMHKAKLVLVDEAHHQAGPKAEKIIRAHVERGAAACGLTATPVELGHLYTHLIQAGVNSELRACGALVPCHTYGPDEPDLRKIKPQATGEYTEKQIRKVIMTPTIFGRVYEWWTKLNPEQKPTILFAPGVAESVWFAQQFDAMGIRAAHIDGDDIWLDGQQRQSTQSIREEIREGSREGSIKIVCNRFVLREGIDYPWLSHCIMATVFGGLSGFLQSGGRLLRAYPGLDHVTLQDHGGNWWRHGSLNADRTWSLQSTNKSCAEDRAKTILEKKEPEPIRCAKCGAIRLHGVVCSSCGFEMLKKSRPVIQEDGSLIEMRGDIYRPRKVSLKSDTQKKWEQCYYRCLRARKPLTFKQVEGLFFRENHYWPPRNLALMPASESDWNRRVADVPKRNLLMKGETT